MSATFLVGTIVYAITFGLSAIVLLAGLAFVWRRRGEDGGGEGSFLGMKFKAASTAALVIMAGAAGVVWSAPKLDPSEQDGNLVDDVLSARVKAIEQIPADPVREGGESDKRAIKKMVAWIAFFSRDARIVIDRGSDDGIKKGDWFATVSNSERLQDLPTASAGNLQDDLTALVEVSAVYSDESVASLEEYAYDAHLRKVIGPEGIAIPPGQAIDMEPLAPVVVDQPVALIPGEEKEAKEQVDRWFERAANAPSDKERSLYRVAELRAGDFLGTYPEGFFAGEILFTEATAQFELASIRQ